MDRGSVTPGESLEIETGTTTASEGGTGMMGVLEGGTREATEGGKETATIEDTEGERGMTEVTEEIGTTGATEAGRKAETRVRGTEMTGVTEGRRTEATERGRETGMIGAMVAGIATIGVMAGVIATRGGSVAGGLGGAGGRTTGGRGGTTGGEEGGGTGGSNNPGTRVGQVSF